MSTRPTFHPDRLSGTSRRIAYGLWPALALVLFVGLVLGLSACGGKGDGDGGTTYDYAITSTSFFTGGQKVNVIRYKIISGDCSSHTREGPTTLVGSGTVVTPGEVSFAFTTGVTPPIFESIYIDNNASGNLDKGDRVWGDDPNNLYGYCFDALNTRQTFDWEVEAAQIQALMGLARPSTIYNGPDRSFRHEPDSKPVLTVGNAFVVDGDGYDGTRW